MTKESPDRIIAYFSMEIALDTDIPTYSGGLGVLAGDTLRSAADLRVPLVAVTLLYRNGYFYQRLDPAGWQREEAVDWVVEDFLQELPQRVSIDLEGRSVQIRAWRLTVRGARGYTVPVYFLDTDLPENITSHRRLTHLLYGGDRRYRLCQEAILGFGGARMLRELGYDRIERFHMNEGHASLLTLELLDEEVRRAGRKTFTNRDVERVRQRCVFTTHTPVPAGHDQFPLKLANRILNRKELSTGNKLFCCDGMLNMTHLALNLSHYVNGVAQKHGETSRLMFAGHDIDAITNGVHAATWTSRPFQTLYDRSIPGWREDNFRLRYALAIPRNDVWRSHSKAKRKFIHFVNRTKNAGMDADVLTIGFARRSTAYKRGDLLFHNLDHLKRVASKAGAFQVVFAGKAHPADRGGKEIIKRIVQARKQLKPHIKVEYLENYDIELGKLITAGVDLWLNTPLPPLEASGTSGMKAALNGVPSISILDGWWIEGCVEGITGWAIDERGAGKGNDPKRSASDAARLYRKLEQVVIPMFYNERERFIEVMRHAMALNGSFYNTHRMMQQYVSKAYFR